MNLSSYRVKRRFIYLGFIMAVIISASILSAGSTFWFLPLIGGLVSGYGLHRMDKRFIDYGHLFSILSFYLINRNMAFELINLILVIGFFFLFFSSWIVNRNEIFLESLERDSHTEMARDRWDSSDKKKEQKEGRIRSFEKSSLKAVLTFVMVGMLLTFTGTFMAMYGSVGIDFPSYYLEPLFILFGILTLSTAYVMIKILPPHINKKEK